MKKLIIFLTFMFSLAVSAEPQTEVVLHGHKIQVNTYNIQEFRITEAQFLGQIKRLFPDEENKKRILKHELKTKVKSLIGKSYKELNSVFEKVKQSPLLTNEKHADPFDKFVGILKSSDRNKALRARMKALNVSDEVIDKAIQSALAYDSLSALIEEM